MELSLFNHLIGRHPQTTRVMFDNSVMTNDKGLDSRDLVIIYNLTMFERESKREEAKRNDIEVLSKLEDLEVDDLVQHPLCELLESSANT